MSLKILLPFDKSFSFGHRKYNRNPDEHVVLVTTKFAITFSRDSSYSGDRFMQLGNMAC